MSLIHEMGYCTIHAAAGALGINHKTLHRQAKRLSKECELDPAIYVPRIGGTSYINCKLLRLLLPAGMVPEIFERATERPLPEGWEQRVEEMAAARCDRQPGRSTEMVEELCRRTG